MFAIMLTEKSLSWYSELLRLSMTESRDLQINPRNCIGTVLALNGHRKYFCMYHAKHPETSRGTKVNNCNNDENDSMIDSFSRLFLANVANGQTFEL
jgi:hypothetical protein